MVPLLATAVFIAAICLRMFSPSLPIQSGHPERQNIRIPDRGALLDNKSDSFEGGRGADPAV